MKATLEISRSHLRQLLRSINRINSVPEQDTHADVHLLISNDLIQIYSHVSPVYILHKLRDGDDLSVDIESPGRISFNIETLVDIVQSAEDGTFEIEFSPNMYRIKTPGGNSFTPVKFQLPRHAESVFEEPVDIGELYSIDSVPRDELRSGLSTMGVIGEFVNLSVKERELIISIQNKVTGNAEFKTPISNSDISSMSQFYMLRPMKEFVSTINDVDSVQILVSEFEDICLRAVVNGWESELHLAPKAAPQKETYLER